MPPKTRRAGNGPTSTGQSTLSFKGRVSKPADSVTTLKNAKSKLNEPAKQIITAEIAKQSTPEPEEESIQVTGKGKSPEVESPVRIIPSPSRRRKVRRSLVDEDDDDSYQVVEKEARGVSDAQIKKYWKAEEDRRTSSRIHQKDLHLHEKILRHFDLCSEYGPCIGISRLQRWTRAQSLALHPPVEVLAVLLKEEDKGEKKSDKRAAGRLAYVDELGGARDVEVPA